MRKGSVCYSQGDPPAIISSDEGEEPFGEACMMMRIDYGEYACM